MLKQYLHLKLQEETTQSNIDLYQYMQSNPVSPVLFRQTPWNNCMRSPNLQQELQDQYKIFQEKLQQNKLNGYIESLEMRKEHFQNESLRILNSFWTIYHTYPNPLHITTIIQNAITQQISTVSNSIATIHKYKLRLLKISN